MAAAVGRVGSSMFVKTLSFMARDGRNLASVEAQIKALQVGAGGAGGARVSVRGARCEISYRGNTFSGPLQSDPSSPPCTQLYHQAAAAKAAKAAKKGASAAAGSAGSDVIVGRVEGGRSARLLSKAADINTDEETKVREGGATVLWGAKLGCCRHDVLWGGGCRCGRDVNVPSMTSTPLPPSPVAAASPGPSPPRSTVLRRSAATSTRSC